MKIGSHQSSRRIRPVRLYLSASGFFVVALASTVGFARDLEASPRAWPVAVTSGALCGVMLIAAWRRFLRRPDRPAVTSRTMNIAVLIVFLLAFPFVLYVISQMLGDMMYRIVPSSLLESSGIKFHPNPPSLLLDGAMAFILTLLLLQALLALGRVYFVSRKKATDVIE